MYHMRMKNHLHVRIYYYVVRIRITDRKATTWYNFSIPHNLMLSSWQQATSRGRIPKDKQKNIFDDFNRIGIMNFSFHSNELERVPVNINLSFSQTSLRMSRINELAVAAIVLGNEKEAHQLFNKKNLPDGSSWPERQHWRCRMTLRTKWSMPSSKKPDAVSKKGKQHIEL